MCIRCHYHLTSTDKAFIHSKNQIGKNGKREKFKFTTKIFFIFEKSPGGVKTHRVGTNFMINLHRELSSSDDCVFQPQRKDILKSKFSLR